MDFLEMAKQALNNIGGSDTDPFNWDNAVCNYAQACAMVEIATQLRRIADNQHSVITKLTDGESAINIFDESRRYPY